MGCGAAVKQEGEQEEVQAKTIGIRSKEAEAAVSKIINVCGYLLGDMFVPRIGCVLQAISNGLFTRGIGIYFIMVCRFITAICGALLSSIYGLISCFNGLVHIQ